MAKFIQRQMSKLVCKICRFILNIIVSKVQHIRVILSA